MPSLPPISRSEKAQRGLINAGNAAGRILAPLLFLAFVAITAAYAWNQVEVLFRVTLMQDGSIVGVPVSHFAAAASVGMALTMLILCKYSPHPSVRAAATLWAVLYIAVTFVLVFVGWLLNGQNNGKLAAVITDARSILPFLPLMGSAAVVILASLGLGCFGVLIGTSKNHPARFADENKARAHLVSNLTKVVVTLASVGFSIWFGVAVLGASAILAALLGIVLDVQLIASWLKAEAAAEAGDVAENRRWKFWAYLFGGAVALMAVESVGTQFKTSAGPGTSEQLLGILNSPLFGWMQAVGALAIIGAIGLSIVQLLATMRPVATVAADSDGVIEGDVTISTPTRPALAARAAAGIRGQREAWGDLRQALTGDKATVKPAQIATTMADDGGDAPIVTTNNTDDDSQRAQSAARASKRSK